MAERTRRASAGPGTSLDAWHTLDARLDATYGATASDGLRVSLPGKPDVWLRMRPMGGADSPREEARGYLVYPHAMPGVDAIYSPSRERVEEFLNIRRDAPMEFAIDLGPGLARLRTDGSGRGLEAVNQAGEVQLRTSVPEGTDAKHRHVIGTLVAKHVAGSRWNVRLVLDGQPTFPVLLDPSWATTGSMATARDFHTATLLPNGKVLVAGGENSSDGILASAELYDPAAGTFASTGTMATTRRFHTATLLTNGKVLVAGGDNGTALASAELYDPAAGTFASTGSMVIARYGNTATLLPNGKVLVAGGYNAGVDLASAELYDPAAGTFASTGAMATVRVSHTATLLPNGKVLVAGGAGPGYLASAELYDPAAGTFATTGAMATAREQHTATLLPNGKVHVAGGQGASGFLASAELYDVGDGYLDSARPVLTSVPASATAGTTLTLAGSNLTGYGEGSGGQSSSNSATNYPLVRLIRIDNGQLIYATTTDTSGAWQATSTTLTVQLPTTLPPGSYMLFVVTNAIPSLGQSIVIKGANGSTCFADASCGSGFCADGVCCNTACAGACDVCNATPGTCTDVAVGSAGSPTCSPYLCNGSASCPASCSIDSDCVVGDYCNGSSQCVAKKTLGQTCGGAKECTSGFCADGDCCNTACSGACDACNLAAKVGTCSDVPAGSAGSPTCSPYLCGGSGATCATSCATDSDCASGDYCNASSQCVTVLSRGSACTRDTECSTHQCVDGFCCNTACSGACDVCDATPGTCTFTGTGTAGNPVCSPYLCGSGAACATFCASDSDCATGTYCGGSGSCIPRRANGQSCATTDQCGSGFCVDGVCCDTACGDGNPIDCQACNVTGSVGKCSPVFDGTSCDDGSVCTSGEACHSGACGRPTSTITCSALDPCHDIGTCDATTGTCSNPPKTDGTSCSDGSACTTGEACHSGTCGAPTSTVTCTALDQCHVAGTCDATTGTCSNPAKTDGSSCNDASACTTGEACHSGVCGAPTSTVTCTALDPCHDIGTCDATSGVCSNPAKADGTSCSGGSCRSGECVPTTHDGGTSVPARPRDKFGCNCASGPGTGIEALLLLGLMLCVRRRRTSALV